jgi:hypothetical protein
MQTTKRPINVDLAATEDRRRRLQKFADDVFFRGNEFVCPHLDQCRGSRRPGDVFFEGTMSHVGRRFDLRLGDKPLRVVVVGQESYGGPMTMDGRYQLAMEIGLKLRFKADGTHRARNPHMRGTTSALRLLFGNGLGADHAGEWVHPTNGEPFHIFDGFALVNRLLCFAGEGTTGRSSRTMRDNCDKYFRETLRILEPTILVLQGKSVQSWTSGALTRVRTFTPNLYEARMGPLSILVCSLTHPSAHGAYRWADLSSRYLTQTVEPTMAEAVRLIGEL